MAAVQIRYALSLLESTLPMTEQVLERALSTTSSEQNFRPASRQFIGALNRFSKVAELVACLARRRAAARIARITIE